MRISHVEVPIASPVHLFYAFFHSSPAAVFFKVKSTTMFSKIFEAYAAQRNLNVKNLSFVFDGQRLQSTGRPSDVRVSFSIGSSRPQLISLFVGRSSRLFCKPAWSAPNGG